MVTFDSESKSGEAIESATADRGLFPDIDLALGEFEALIQWQAVTQWDRIPEPVKGFDATYDTAKSKEE